MSHPNGGTGMYFCENCNALNKTGKCSLCGKELRPVRKDDYCYFVTLPAHSFEIFKSNLEENGIPVACLGSGLNFAWRTSSEFKVFIPFEFIEQAKELYESVFRIYR